MVPRECVWFSVICGTFNRLHICEYIASVLYGWGGSGREWECHFYYLFTVQFVCFIEIFLDHLSFVKNNKPCFLGPIIWDISNRKR